MVRTVSDTTEHPSPSAPAPAAVGGAGTTAPTSPEAGSVQADFSGDELPPQWIKWSLLILSLVAVGSSWLAWQTDKRVKALEQELVRRMETSRVDVAEGKLLSRRADEQSREAAARATLVETRLNEVALQRTQVEDLIKNLSLSRDENLVADLETGLRVAMQQSALTGSAEPLLIAMQTADERLARAKQPRLDNVRRALARDLDRLKSTRVADVNNLSIRLDEAVRLVDDVPLLNQPEASANATATPARGAARANRAAPSRPSEPASAASAPATWGDRLVSWSGAAAHTVWSEARALVRITQVRQPEGMLLTPEQSFFLRENVKLRLLNARLALLSRQTAIVQADLKTVRDLLPRYFKAESSKTSLLASMIEDVAAQSRLTTIPRPDDTLAALALLSGGR